jgi:hypothetical protein
MARAARAVAEVSRVIRPEGTPCADSLESAPRIPPLTVNEASFEPSGIVAVVRLPVILQPARFRAEAYLANKASPSASRTGRAPSGAVPLVSNPTGFSRPLTIRDFLPFHSCLADLQHMDSLDVARRRHRRRLPVPMHISTIDIGPMVPASDEEAPSDALPLGPPMTPAVTRSISTPQPSPVVPSTPFSMLREVIALVVAMDLEKAPVGVDSWLDGTVIDFVALQFQQIYSSACFLPTDFAVMFLPAYARGGSSSGSHQPRDLAGRELRFFPPPADWLAVKADQGDPHGIEPDVHVPRGAAFVLPPALPTATSSENPFHRRGGRGAPPAGMMRQKRPRDSDTEPSSMDSPMSDGGMLDVDTDDGDSFATLESDNDSTGCARPRPDFRYPSSVWPPPQLAAETMVRQLVRPDPGSPLVVAAAREERRAARQSDRRRKVTALVVEALSERNGLMRLLGQAQRYGRLGVVMDVLHPSLGVPAAKCAELQATYSAHLEGELTARRARRKRRNGSATASSPARYTPPQPRSRASPSPESVEQGEVNVARWAELNKPQLIELVAAAMLACCEAAEHLAIERRTLDIQEVVRSVVEGITTVGPGVARARALEAVARCPTSTSPYAPALAQVVSSLKTRIQHVGTWVWRAVAATGSEGDATMNAARIVTLASELEPHECVKNTHTSLKVVGSTLGTHIARAMLARRTPPLPESRSLASTGTDQQSQSPASVPSQELPTQECTLVCTRLRQRESPPLLFFWNPGNNHWNLIRIQTAPTPAIEVFEPMG